jgi:hypothetical protein
MVQAAPRRRTFQRRIKEAIVRRWAGGIVGGSDTGCIAKTDQIGEVETIETAGFFDAYEFGIYGDVSGRCTLFRQ